ncbi:MAG TPA: alpha-hydroxy acid oxidase [Ktedonobacterales bacterium]|jgi:isopentenyl diphosphate isomerase/L-lactate dehydrogenase-like FMN-dependent dehydrogenase|nr:alpha-hydroxy acid oxidase [Ktedonobacterales bacterium]
MLPLNVAEYEALAEPRMHPAAWDYYATGTDDEVTLRENQAAFARIWLRPRMLADVSSVDAATTVLGTPVSMPILIAPTAMHRFACEEGERATARAAGAAGTLMTASTESWCPLEDIASAATGPLWFQLYVYRSRTFAESLVRRAEAAGFRAIVLTVDSPRWSRRQRSMRSEAEIPQYWTGNLPEIEGETYDTLVLTWADIAWLRSLTSLPLVLKGILTAEDATLAVEHGIDGIVVSNHGGRQLDTVPATIEALPEVVDAVAGHCEVYLDGGIRRGTDALKALAHGARAVLVGRPILWGLAVNGEEGARHVLELLHAELELAMALAGRPTVASIDRSLARLPK